ncbi:MAG: tRNA (N(6)-L-threonylcarbamoyladenosine(37)-C(2))-methylthiotransferase MtaB [Chloroflexi bacterium]|nr:tRNA (N(6)-L-threonylcarbamoyladenosine(37)-C(2))-methylthiotransferase MtaB [Chloroflexota bacterium]
MKIALETLGCKLNQAETESLARQLTEAGHMLVPSDEADAYILNTCTVTHIADSKSRHLLRMAHRHNPDALVIATGCYAQRAPQELARIEGVSHIVNNDDKSNLLKLLEQYGKPDCTPRSTEKPALRTRAFVKVQDGCGSFCTYCVVPLVRGTEKSLPIEEVVEEVRHRVATGYKEVVLTGTKIGSYHHDDSVLKDLLERILSKTAITRLRLSSLQPQEISPELLGMWQDSRLCPHFHLSLQSGSDSVLGRMNRRYSAKEYQEALSLIRNRVPDTAITTDIIVGFPGETDAEFEESYETCRKSEFARIHVFTYSPRQGTAAARMPQQVPDNIKRQRSQRMLALAAESAERFRQRFVGKLLPVLWEQQNSDGLWAGFTDNYIKVETRSNQDLTNKLELVKIPTERRTLSLL